MPIILKNLTADQVHTGLAHVGVTPRLARQIQTAVIRHGTLPSGPGISARLMKEVRKLTVIPRLALIEKKARVNPELRTLLTVAAPKLEEVLELIDPGVALVEYFHPGRVEFEDGKVDELWAFVITRGESVLVPVSVTQKDLRDTAEAYARAASGEPGELDALSAKLYGWLVEPVRGKLAGCDTVVIVPWDVLYYVPFSALAPEAGAPPFGAEKRLVVAPSAGVYRYIRPKRASKHRRLFAMGDPETEQHSLEQAEKEVKTISELFDKSTLYLRSDATETILKAGIGKADVVHFACHGRLDEAHPELSHLLLTPDAANDGRLEVHEIFGLDWRGVSLVTLSACSSGKGKLGGGNDIIGLTRGFIFAGAPTVLCTLWEVDDESTRIFMQEFYRHYAAGTAKPEAFQLAQAKLRASKKWSHPYHWAPFVLWGDWK